MPRTHARPHPPAIDERIVMPESGVEILDGELLMVPGADPPHARRHAALAYLLAAHTAPGFVATVDMLTRTSVVSDFAPDVSVYPEGPDPDTGGRRLELIAFEIVSKQALAVPTKKARELARRGVRRVFAVVVKRERVLEWDARLGRWRPMHKDEVIEETCLSPGLPIRALLDGTSADETVLAALEHRRPDLMAKLEARAEAKGEAKGEANGAEAAREAVRELCSALGVPLDEEREAELARASLGELRALVRHVARTRSWPAA